MRDLNRRTRDPGGEVCLLSGGSIGLLGLAPASILAKLPIDLPELALNALEITFGRDL